MSQDSQQAIMHVLQQDSAVLGTLMSKLKFLKDLHGILTLYLEPKLASHCQLASMEKACLTVITDSALWATQFRFQVPVLQKQLQQHPEFSQLKKIVCKIRPAVNKRMPSASGPVVPPLSAATAEFILLAAKNIRHEKLQQIMEKIAQQTFKDN